MNEQNTTDLTQLAAQLAATQTQLTTLLQQHGQSQPAAPIQQQQPAGHGLIRKVQQQPVSERVVYGLGVPVIVEMSEGQTAFCTAWIGPEHLVNADTFDAAITYVEENIGRVYTKGDRKSGGLRRK